MRGQRLELHPVVDHFAHPFEIGLVFFQRRGGFGVGAARQAVFQSLGRRLYAQGGAAQGEQGARRFFLAFGLAAQFADQFVPAFRLGFGAQSIQHAPQRFGPIGLQSGLDDGRKHAGVGQPTNMPGQVAGQLPGSRIGPWQFLGPAAQLAQGGPILTRGQALGGAGHQAQRGFQVGQAAHIENAHLQGLQFSQSLIGVQAGLSQLRLGFLQLFEQAGIFLVPGHDALLQALNRRRQGIR